MRQIYLDNNATTPVHPAVLEAMVMYLRVHFGNASSIHGFGRTARKAIEEARGQVAELIGAQPDDIVFTGCGSESDNMALKGVALANRQAGAHIITTSIEHPAVLGSCEQLERMGFEVTYLPVSRAGLISVSDLRAALRPTTLIVSIMHGNNEVGTIQPIEQCGSVVRAYGEEIGRRIAFHSDCVQTLGKLPLDVTSLDADLLAFSAHKLYAPKGVGALYVRDATVMDSLISGGHQELNRRGGTENVAGIVGFGVACALARQEMDEVSERCRKLRDRLEAGLAAAAPGVYVNGDPTHRLPTTLNISFAGIDGESLLINLDLEGIAASTGSACTSGSTEPSHVLRAMGIDKQYIRGSLRLSIGRENTEADIDAALEVIPAIVERMRAISPHWEETQAAK